MPAARTARGVPELVAGDGVAIGVGDREQAGQRHACIHRQGHIGGGDDRRGINDGDGERRPGGGVTGAPACPVRGADLKAVADGAGNKIGVGQQV